MVYHFTGLQEEISSILSKYSQRTQLKEDNINRLATIEFIKWQFSDWWIRTCQKLFLFFWAFTNTTMSHHMKKMLQVSY